MITASLITDADQVELAAAQAVLSYSDKNKDELGLAWLTGQQVREKFLKHNLANDALIRDQKKWARSCARNLLRDGSRRDRLQFTDELESLGGATKSSQADAVADQEFKSVVLELMRQGFQASEPDEAERSIVQRYIRGDLSGTEAANQLGISRNALYLRAHRVTVKVRRYVNDRLAKEDRAFLPRSPLLPN